MDFGPNQLKMLTIRVLVPALAVCCACATVRIATAQPPGGNGPGWGGQGGMQGGFRFDPRAMYSRMDANKNGMIEPEEMSERFRGMMGQSGLDLDKPIAIDKLVELTNQRMQQGWGRGRGQGGGQGGGQGNGQGGPEGGRGDRGFRDGGNRNENGQGQRDNDAAGKSEENAENSSNASNKKPRVAGFGDAAGTSGRPSGFGNNPDKKANEPKPNDGKADEPGAKRSNSDGEQKKFREYAQSLINQYDKDKDGSLKKSAGEWDELPQKHQKADSNNDNVISGDEMFEYVSGLSEKSGSAKRDSNENSRGAASKSQANIKSYRAASPAERLPKGLPDWFERNDSDRDGQIMMSEFAASWTDDKANEFRSYDLNGDGVITAKECLKKSDGGKKDRR